MSEVLVLVHLLQYFSVPWHLAGTLPVWQQSLSEVQLRSTLKPGPGFIGIVIAITIVCNRFRILDHKY